MSTLLERYNAYMAKWEGNRQTLAMPCCGQELEVQAPSEPGEVWDSMIECPYCGEHSFKVVTHDKAIARIPA